MTDNRGTELRIGQRVAYNLSGELACGEITDLIEGTPGRYDGHYEKWPMIKVKLAHRAAGFPAGHISKVRNPKNVLVLGTGER